MNSPRGFSRKTGGIHRFLAILLLIAFLVLARSEDDSAAWSQIGRLTILEAKPGPGFDNSVIMWIINYTC